MALPFFYAPDIAVHPDQYIFNEDSSRHVAQVLRMNDGEQLQLTDGKGNVYTAGITDNSKKRCSVKIISSHSQPAPDKKITIAISVVKNMHRFEWFLEKATEIGVTGIIPLLCSRTEKQHFRHDRMQGLLISAMLQSQQSWLPVLGEPEKFISFVKRVTGSQKFIAHCEDHEAKIQLTSFQPFFSPVILIGPEGDFTIDEIEAAFQNNFKEVALGDTRLRTETAGVVAATIFKLC